MEFCVYRLIIYQSVFRFFILFICTILFYMYYNLEANGRLYYNLYTRSDWLEFLFLSRHCATVISLISMLFLSLFSSLLLYIVSRVLCRSSNLLTFCEMFFRIFHIFQDIYVRQLKWDTLCPHIKFRTT